MDATVIAALIGAGAKLTPSFFARAKALLIGTKELSDDQYYSKLRPLISDNCYLTLRVAEDGLNHPPEHFLIGIYRDQGKKLGLDRNFLSEFRYRLRFLMALQLLDSGNTDEYRITKAGSKFMAMARQTKDFVLAGRGESDFSARSPDDDVIRGRMVDALREFLRKNPDKTWMTLQHWQ